MIVVGFSGIPNGEFYRRRYGLRFVGHDSAVALFVDGRLTFALEEERPTRAKHTSALPTSALGLALDSAQLRVEDVDCFVYPWHATPGRLASMFARHPWRIPVWHWPALAGAGVRVVRDLMSPRRAGIALAEAIGSAVPRGRTRGVGHHLAHAAAAYYSSPFDEAAVLTVDGQGEDESATLGEFRGTRYRSLGRIPTPDSIGILYGMVTDFLGMRAAWDEYKVMGMAAYGDPMRFRAAFDRLVSDRSDGRYRTHRTAMVFRPGYCDRMLARLLGLKPRRHPEELEQVHFDVAAALQSATERVLMRLAERLRQLTKARNLCLAGGVFQNSVANGKLLARGLFDSVHVPPVPGDHGASFGAAAWWVHRDGRAPRRDLHFSPFLGTDFSEATARNAIEGHGRRLDSRRPASIETEVADLLAQQSIVAWVQGRDEFGPRALGHRSILASPRDPEMRDTINARVKHREPFRPFGGVVPAERAAEFFDCSEPSPYMQFVVPVRDSARQRIPSIVHHGTCRIQTVTAESDPQLHRLLLETGRRTGVPILLNTSFNDADEPIVHTPADACRTFLKTDLDALALGPYLVRAVRDQRPQM